MTNMSEDSVTVDNHKIYVLFNDIGKRMVYDHVNNYKPRESSRIHPMKYTVYKP